MRVNHSPFTLLWNYTPLKPMKIKRAIFSVYDKTPEELALAHALEMDDTEIVASGGTKERFLEPGRINVIDCAEITGLDPVLDHRVVTLAPQIHGGLLAEQKHLEELARLGWPEIDLVMCTFYPLNEMMKDPKKTFEDINAHGVDIGGPTMVRSAVKGGKWVLIDNGDVEWFTEKIIAGSLNEHDRLWLHAKAIAHIDSYVAQESEFRTNLIRPDRISS